MSIVSDDNERDGLELLSKLIAWSENPGQSVADLLKEEDGNE